MKWLNKIKTHDSEFHVVDRQVSQNSANLIQNNIIRNFKYSPDDRLHETLSHKFFILFYYLILYSKYIMILHCFFVHWTLQRF